MMKTSIKNTLLVSTVALFLSGCATFLPKSAETENVEPVSSVPLEERWEAHQHKISTLTTWTLKGKAAVSSRNQGNTATVIWQQQSHGYDLELYGLLGQGRTQLVAKENDVRLITHKGTELRATNAQGLLGEYMGWYLPVDNLYYWVRGIPAPGTYTALKLNNQGQLEQLQQTGWTITYSNYTQVKGLWLPTRITLKYPGDAVQPPLTVKWLSKDWVF